MHGTTEPRNSDRIQLDVGIFFPATVIFWGRVCALLMSPLRDEPAMEFITCLLLLRPM